MLLLVATSECLKLLHSPVLSARWQGARPSNEKCFQKKSGCILHLDAFPSLSVLCMDRYAVCILIFEGEVLQHCGSREAAWRCVLPRADGCLQLINGLGRTAEKGEPAAGSTVMPVKHFAFFPS